MDTASEKAFAKAMLDPYRDALKLGYKASYFLRMLHDLGAVNAAKQLIHNPSFSSGFTQLYELQRLDLSVEAIVLQPQWLELFDDADRKAARKKLETLHYVAP